MKARVRSRIAVAIAGVLLLSHCAQVPVDGREVSEPLPGQDEIVLGVEAHQAVLQEYAALDHPALQAYVDAVGQRLARQSSRADLAWRFTMVDSPDANAFSLPDGHVYLTRGILLYLSSEAELAAVIGHEIGHVTARHGLRQRSTPTAVVLGSVLAPEAETPTAAPLLQTLAQARTSGYGREQELEADRLGAKYLARGGYSPEAMIDAIGALENQASTGGATRRLSPGAYHGIYGSQSEDDARRRRLGGKASSHAAIQPPAGRDEYLHKLVGLHVGDSPEQGVIRNNLLLHERLGLALQFPPGWQVHNRPDRVLATNREGDALLELQAGPKRGTPLDTLKKGVKLDAGARYDSGKLGGYPAAFAAGAQAGKPVVVAAVAFSGTQYLIAGMTRDKPAYERERSALRAAINSFHPITAAEKKAARTYTLQLVTVRPGQTMADLARESPLGADAESQLRLMNGLYPNGEPKPGQLLKIVQ
jgi:predicted Zn-dependent protease